MQNDRRVQPPALIAPQVGEELRVGEVLAQLVGDMYRKSGLAHPRWSIDGHDRATRHSVGAEQPATEFLDLISTPDEIGHIVGQLSRYSEHS